MNDLPTTSKTHALRCKQAAETQGLHRVPIGNVHLLGRDYQRLPQTDAEDLTSS